jgi:hypothetical protein
MYPLRVRRLVFISLQGLSVVSVVVIRLRLRHTCC